MGPVRGVRAFAAPRALMSSAFAAGFGAACLIALVAAVRVFAGSDPETGPAVMTALALNLGLIIGLGGYIGVRVYELVRGRGRDAPAPRLHLRLVGFLSVSALVPAVVVAAFLGLVFVRVLDAWFEERVRSTMESVASVARTYLATEGRVTRDDVSAMALDLSQDEVADALTSSRITYANYVRQQAIFRGFAAAFVIDESGAVLARATGDVGDTPTYVPPLPEELVRADNGEMPWTFDRDTGRLRLLYKLEGYDASYLSVIRALDPAIVAQLRSAEESLTAYREASERRGRLQAILGLLYLEIALLVLVGAAWLGLVAANRIVAPIGRLVRAADRVRDGDLNARVAVADSQDELAMLSRAFNEMTAQLTSQRSEVVAAKEDAEARQRFTEAVLAGASAGVMGLDATGRVTTANRSAMALLALPAEHDLVGQDITQAAPEFASVVRSARETPDLVIDSQIELERDGRVRNLDVRASAAREAGGGVVITFDDITRLVTAQRNAAWRDVARRIAHEIRNPLTPIQLSAERLRRKYAAEASEPEIFERCVDTIVRQVADIGRMVDEFSSYARMPTPRMERVDACECARGAVFAQRVASPEITVDSDTPADPVWVTADERLLVQALANVLKNASESVSARLEADPGGKGPAGRVAAHVRVEGDNAVIAISDNGLGWPATQRERLLEPYMTTREKGTGLGLAIVSRVMEDHHGRLELADRDDGGPGAVVRLVLPLDRGDFERPSRHPTDEENVA